MGEPAQLSRRERQIMEAIYARGQATANEVVADLPDPPTKTAVRTLLTILEAKGYVRHFKQSREFVYRPTEARSRAGRSAIRRVLSVFFDGSLEKAVGAHLADPQAALSEEDLDRLMTLIRNARKKGL